jgi:hypothetical protein
MPNRLKRKVDRHRLLRNFGLNRAPTPPRPTVATVALHTTLGAALPVVAQFHHDAVLAVLAHGSDACLLWAGSLARRAGCSWCAAMRARLRGLAGRLPASPPSWKCRHLALLTNAHRGPGGSSASQALRLWRCQLWAKVPSGMGELRSGWTASYNKSGCGGLHSGPRCARGLHIIEVVRPLPSCLGPGSGSQVGESAGNLYSNRNDIGVRSFILSGAP